VGVEVDGRLQAGLLLGISGESVELVEVRLACARERAPGGGGARRRRRAVGRHGGPAGGEGGGGAAAVEAARCGCCCAQVDPRVR